MPKDTQIKFREEAHIKRKAAAIFRSVGLDTSTAIRMFLRQVVKTKQVPLRMESGYTAKGEKAILKADRQIDEDMRSGRAKSYKDAASAIASLKKKVLKNKKDEE